MCADTFAVGIRLTEAEFQVVVGVPSDVDSGWTDPEAFQSLVTAVVWDHLDRQRVLEAISDSFREGETATLGTVTLKPDGSVVSRDLTQPTSVDEVNDVNKDELV
jgi:hypothetical protein